MKSTTLNIPGVTNIEGIYIEPPLVAILGASFNTGNHGVSALASGTLSAIKQSIPCAQVVVLDYGREPTRWTEFTSNGSVTVDLINLRFSKRLFLRNNIARLLFIAGLIRIVPFKALRAKLVKRNRWLNRIAKIDIHFSLNGGDSFSDIYGMSRLLYVALPQLLVLLLERPLVLLPQTYGPFNSLASKLLARALISRSRIVFSRDNEGLTVIKKLMGGAVIQSKLAYDMGFALEPIPPSQSVVAKLESIKANGELIGFNPSGLLMAGGYSKKNMFGLATDYMDLIDALLAFLLDAKGCHVLLVPHVFGPEEMAESDVGACKEIIRKFGNRYVGRLHYFPEYLDHHETKYVIGQCNLFMGSRMHACIGALSQCVPAIGLAYSRKFAGVMELLGEGAAVVDLRSADLNLVRSQISAAWERRSAMRHSLAATIPALKESILNIFKDSAVLELFLQRE